MLRSPLFRGPSWKLTLQAHSGIRRSAFVLLMICSVIGVRWPQDITPKEREQAQAMLQDVAKDVKMFYYDPHLHGVDWDTKVEEAKNKIEKADSLNRALTAVAAVLDDLKDSHTFFLPPPRPYVHDYGFQMQMVADHCYVTRVHPGSDAETKGLKAGDQIIAVNGYAPTRGDFMRMEYVFWILRPQDELHLRVRGLDNAERQIDVIAKFRQLPKVKDLYEMNIFDIYRSTADEEHSLGIRYANRNYDLLIVKLPEFMPFSDAVDALDSKTEGYKAVLFDLRGDPGGSEDMLQSLLGVLFENKVKIGDRIGRGTSKPIETEHHFHKFNGKVAVLVDSQSASAAELFARVIQLEKRGVVIGDQSAGAVMEAERYLHRTAGSNADSYIVFGTEVTRADIIMTDGKSLEGRGVTPDVVVVPSASDFANGRDPALAKAAELLNVQMSPEEAGKLFPYVWPKE